MEHEEWALGTATATAIKGTCGLTVALRGVITAPAYEALHVRLARVRCRRRMLVILDDALLAATSKSLAEAAGRGTPVSQAKPADAVIIAISPWRLEWAVQHCAQMTADGLCRAVALLPAAAAGTGASWVGLQVAW